MIDHAVVFAAAFGAYVAGHQVGDYWVQSSGQARRKGQAGWAGRWACTKHVAGHTLTLAVCLAVVTWWLRLPVGLGNAAAGLAINAVTHWWADRRSTLAWLADRVGQRRFYESGSELSSGAAYLDQSFHWLWLTVAALLTAGR